MINTLGISYPDFKLQEVINPDEFDQNNKEIVDKVNAMLDVLNQITDSIEDGSSGADAISLTSIAPFTSTKLQTYLEEVVAHLRENAGASFVGSAPITGVTGNTVRTQLESLKALLDAEKIRVDGKFNTEKTRVNTEVTRLDSRIDTNVNTLQNTLNQNSASITSLQNQINALNNTYSTDAERVQAITDVVNAYKIADGNLETLITNKVDKGNVYTKEEINNMTLGSYAVANLSGHTLIDVDTNEVEINIPEYVHEQDAISIYVGGTYQTVGVDVEIVTIDGKYMVRNLNGAWNSGTRFDFVVIKNTKVLNASDKVNAGLTLLSGTLPKHILTPALRSELDGKASASDVAVLVGSVDAHKADDVKHGIFTKDGKRYQGQWLPNDDLTGMKFVYEEVL